MDGMGWQMAYTSCAFIAVRQTEMDPRDHQGVVVLVEQSKSFAATQIVRNGKRLEMASEQKERKKQRKEKMRRSGRWKSANRENWNKDESGAR